MSKSESGCRGLGAGVVIAAVLLAGAQGKAQLPCVGDCNANGAVAINELIIGVNIALGARPVQDCASFDVNENGAVAVNELIQAVNAALRGCSGAAPTPTPTIDPDVIAAEVAGASAAVANALSSISNVVGAVVAGASGGAGGGAALSGLSGGGAGDIDPCELDGTVFSDIAIVGLAANVTIDFDMCEVSRPGGSVVFDGLLTVMNLNLQFRGTGSFNATIVFKDDQGNTSAETVAAIQSPVALTVAAGGGNPCAVDIPILGSQVISGIDMTALTGTLSSLVPGEGSAQVTFASTVVELDISQSGADCVPTSFDLLFNGNSEIEQSVGTSTVAFDLEFDAFLLSAMQSGDQSLVTMSGDLIADCFGGMVTLGTPQNLSFLLGQFCPGSGTISIEDIGEIVYSQQGVSVAGMSFASCLDPALLSCVQ